MTANQRLAVRIVASKQVYVIRPHMPRKRPVHAELRPNRHAVLAVSCKIVSPPILGCDLDLWILNLHSVTLWNSCRHLVL